ncbi:MAG: helix-turn-helix domain-containing protein [Flavobacteriales bacterium]|nr:helix-turn-helix domain-containing protein [Flavobacteriales bacterium]
MNTNLVSICRITDATTIKRNEHDYAVCWIKEGITGVEIDGVLHTDLANSILFLHPQFDWKISKQAADSFAGYVMYLPKETFDTQVLRGLHIHKVQLFAANEIPLFKLSPGIERRTQDILEMIDELSGSHLNKREDGILSLLNTFFVYCDGQCNIKSVITGSNSKANLVYQFKQLVNRDVLENHEVSYYAELLNISPKYLNDCVQEVISTSVKSIIVEQLVMRSRRELRFSSKSIKEISFELGFSSPDYFSSFFKTHAGMSPSGMRKAV